MRSPSWLHEVRPFQTDASVGPHFCARAAGSGQFLRKKARSRAFVSPAVQPWRAFGAVRTRSLKICYVNLVTDDV
jgi:hypothetical protein